MATKRTPAHVDPVTDPALGRDPSIEPAPDADPVEAPAPGQDPSDEAAAATVSTDDEAAVVTGTWFKWDTSEGTASATHGHVVVAAPHVIEQGVSMGLLARL